MVDCVGEGVAETLLDVEGEEDIEAVFDTESEGDAEGVGEDSKGRHSGEDSPSSEYEPAGQG